MDQQFMLNVAEIIKEKREKLGLTQTEVGRRVNRPQPSIARLESGYLGDIHFSFILDIAAALEMKPEELVATAFGRNVITETRELKIDENLQKVLDRLQETDPLTRKLVWDMFNNLIKWLKNIVEKEANNK